MASGKIKTVWFCTDCGNESPKWMGQCPASQNSYLAGPICPCPGDDGTVYYAPIEMPDTHDGKVFTAIVTSEFVKLPEEPKRWVWW